MSEQQGTHGQPPARSAAWERIERARHPQRPYPMDFIERIFTDFSEIHGDRAYGDDEAVAVLMSLRSTPARSRRTSSSSTKRCVALPLPRPFLHVIVGHL